MAYSIINGMMEREFLPATFCPMVGRKWNLDGVGVVVCLGSRHSTTSSFIYFVAPWGKIVGS